MYIQDDLKGVCWIQMLGVLVFCGSNPLNKTL